TRETKTPVPLGELVAAREPAEALRERALVQRSLAAAARHVADHPRQDHGVAAAHRGRIALARDERERRDAFREERRQRAADAPATAHDGDAAVLEVAPGDAGRLDGRVDRRDDG